MGLPTRKEQIEELVDYLVENAGIKELVAYFRDTQLDYFERLSDEELKESYIDCFGVDEP